MKIELGTDELDRVAGGRFQIHATPDGSTTVDNNMQMASLNLKSSADKFSEVTSLIQAIMDSNKDIFGKIAGSTG